MKRCTNQSNNCKKVACSSHVTFLLLTADPEPWWNWVAPPTWKFLLSELWQGLPLAVATAPSQWWEAHPFTKQPSPALNISNCWARKCWGLGPKCWQSHLAKTEACAQSAFSRMAWGQGCVGVCALCRHRNPCSKKKKKERKETATTTTKKQCSGHTYLQN